MIYPSPPLDPCTQSIRLCSFRWQDGREMGDEDIAVSLRVVDINDPACPSWISLSYTWGNFQNYHEQESPAYDVITRPQISLNGVTTPITMNLWRGLDAILQQEETRLSGDLPEWTAIRYFWIDAICINQADMEERSHQVSLMGLIYSRTAGVIVYLAPDMADDSETESFSDAFELYMKRVAKNTSLSEECACIAKPFVNPYWTRIWIVQEVLLAPNIMWLYEDSWMPEEMLRSLGAAPELSMTAPSKLLQSRQTFQSGEPLGVPILLETYQDNLCSDPKDRLYGLLGVLPPGYALEVDYKVTNVDLFFKVMHLERHMPKYLYHMYRFAQNLQKALELGQDLTLLVIVATVMFYEIQDAKGLLDTLEVPLTEYEISSWLVTTLEGQQFLRDEIRAPPEAFGAQLGQKSRFIPWTQHDIERLRQIHTFPAEILTPEIRPKTSFLHRAFGKAAQVEPWRRKLQERDNKRRRQELWVEQHALTRDLQRLAVTGDSYRQMGKSGPYDGTLRIETLYMSSSTPFFRRQGSRDDMWNAYTTLHAFNS